MKTKEQMVSDKRHKSLSLPTKQATPRKAQKPIIEPRREQLLPYWS